MSSLPEVIRAITLLHSSTPGAREELESLWAKQCQTVKDKNVRMHSGGGGGTQGTYKRSPATVQRASHTGSSSTLPPKNLSSAQQASPAHQKPTAVAPTAPVVVPKVTAKSVSTATRTTPGAPITPPLMSTAAATTKLGGAPRDQPAAAAVATASAPGAALAPRPLKEAAEADRKGIKRKRPIPDVPAKSVAAATAKNPTSIATPKSEPLLDEATQAWITDLQIANKDDDDSDDSDDSSADEDLDSGGVAGSDKVDADAGREYVVDKLLKHKVHRGKLSYLVKWEGYGTSEVSWEPEENIGGKVIVRYKEDNDIPLSETDHEWLAHEAGEDAEVYCTVCKSYDSFEDNPIVMCDECGNGYHGKCHDPRIDQDTIDDEDAEWLCADCKEGLVNAPRHAKGRSSASDSSGAAAADDDGESCDIFEAASAKIGMDKKMKRVFDGLAEKDRSSQDRRKRSLQEATGVSGNRTAFLKGMKSKMKRLRGGHSRR